MHRVWIYGHTAIKEILVALNQHFITIIKNKTESEFLALLHSLFLLLVGITFCILPYLSFTPHRISSLQDSTVCCIWSSQKQPHTHKVTVELSTFVFLIAFGVWMQRRGACTAVIDRKLLCQYCTDQESGPEHTDCVSILHLFVLSVQRTRGSNSHSLQHFKQFLAPIMGCAEEATEQI